MSATVVSLNVYIDSVIFVDDISGGGDIPTVEEAGRNLNLMETRKAFTFNVDEKKHTTWS